VKSGDRQYRRMGFLLAFFFRISTVKIFRNNPKSLVGTQTHRAASVAHAPRESPQLSRADRPI